MYIHIRHLITEKYWLKGGNILGIFWEYFDNKTFRKLDDNDVSVEHAGVSARQRKQTLERVVKHYQEALAKA